MSKEKKDKVIGQETKNKVIGYKYKYEKKAIKLLAITLDQHVVLLTYNYPYLNMDNKEQKENENVKQTKDQENDKDVNDVDLRNIEIPELGSEEEENDEVHCEGDMDGYESGSSSDSQDLNDEKEEERLN